jgi:hypothetical protein
VTLSGIQAKVERRDRAFASAATMIWASALTAGAVSMSVVIPRTAQARPVRNAVAGGPSIVRRKGARALPEGAKATQFAIHFLPIPTPTGGI